jgi:hypothetical protein
MHRMARLTRLLLSIVLTSCASEGLGLEDADATSETSPHDACSPAPASNQVHELLEVWVDLTEPPLRTAADANEAARAALRERVDRQQNAVMMELARLGAVEQARIVQVRNAIAVRIPSTALAQARSIPGVKKIRVVKHRKRTPPCSSRN